MSSIKASADNRNVTIAVGHHAADLSANACSTAAVAAATTATPVSPAAVASPAPGPTGRHNVSVTNIKCEVDELMVSPPPPMEPPSPSPNVAVLGGFYHDSGGGIGIRIPVPKAELHDSAEDDSETELTNIENSVSVTRRVSASTAGLSNGAAHPHAGHKNGPRPMSWEGELSDTETNMTDEIMDTGEGEHRQGPSSPSGKTRSDSPGKVTVKKSEEISALPPKIHAEPSPVTGRLAGPIKPDLEMEVSLSQVAAGVGTLYTSPHPPTKLKLGPTQSDPINLKYEPADAAANSPLMARQKSITNLPPLPANPSPDSAIHSVYTHSSPSQSPLTSRHAPYTPSLSRNNSDASHSSCYSYSSEFSPTHSPIQGRHAAPPPPSGGASSLYTSFNGSSASLHHVSQSVLYRPISGEGGAAAEAQNLSMDTQSPLNMSTLGPAADGLPSSAAGISRQQLINSPCPICGDKISGFHYGIFSCESCKGFFKRTVQNRKNYVCVRGGPCPVSIATRKKCPACRFEKCLQKGMKLEAIREDRTRGGRSTYQCSYTLPNSLLSPLLSPEQAQGGNGGSPGGQHQPSRLGIASSLGGGGGGPSSALNNSMHHHGHSGANGYAASGGGSSQIVKLEKYVPDMHIGARGPPDTSSVHEASANGAQRGCSGNTHGSSTVASPPRGVSIPTLLQEIMDVEHLWQYNEAELSRLNQPTTGASGPGGGPSASQMTNPLLASAGLSSGDNANPDLIAHLCNVADHRLYKIVKWCKSLPLFKNISIDDQICLLINSWCELLLFSCCFRSIDTPGEIKMSQGKKISLSMAKSSGLQSCIERMLNLTDHLRRLRVDRYEYVAMKVIVLLQSDTSELREPVRVRECQEKALQSLQSYTLSHYPDVPSKFGELLLRIPDLQRTCQLGKEMLTIKSRDGGDFNLLMELLRGEH